jgi:hypothetical protein
LAGYRKVAVLIRPYTVTVRFAALAKNPSPLFVSGGLGVARGPEWELGQPDAEIYRVLP